MFVIGMRFNKPWRVRTWLPVATAMPKMLRVLDQHPELGCLGYHQWVGRTTVMVQYWRDFESLDRFARDASLPHLEPWRRFNKAVRDSGDVGTYHETYKVRAGEYEAVYGNMPAFGLAAASAHMPVAKRGQSAAGRIGARGRPGDGAVLRASAKVPDSVPSSRVNGRTCRVGEHGRSPHARQVRTRRAE